MTIRSIGIRILKDNTAATAVEYGLILALIVIAMIVALNGVANETVGMWNTISSKSATAIEAS
ncbi:pilus assembly protein Flp/PilA [Novosphingobium sp. PhB165]|uniref:Flp family type IVb pilin n=1 Tax=Novosphingobium sp. PhB165 TaxID=2485105 RepID=UPI00104C9731|nr:Flp family type IVb pilin [Novosphingobium sp. PhB165]TCM22343.1 pilus assembly protein Flp/PilA [Novosphingobium sp. PhB165]